MALLVDIQGIDKVLEQLENVLIVALLNTSYTNVCSFKEKWIINNRLGHGS